MIETLKVMSAFGKVKILFPIFVLVLALSVLTGQGGFWIPIIWGFMSHGIIEYYLHRFAYHHEPSEVQSEFNAQYRTHIGHHEFPQNPEFLTGGGHGGFELKIGSALSLIYFILLFPFLGLEIACWTAVKIVFVGNLFGLFFYEYCHTLAHLRIKKGWFGTMVTQNHLAHHYQDHNSNFHVSPTAAWLDWAFATRFDKEKARARFDRNTIMSLGIDPRDARLVLARKHFNLPKKQSRDL